MAIFRETTRDGERYLVVLHHADAAIETGIKLQICPSIESDVPPSRGIGASSLSIELKFSRGDSVHKLNSSIHTLSPREDTFVTLGRRIFDGEVKWGSQHMTQGAFTYVERYWEWLEDVLSRNGEMLKKNAMFDALYASLFSYTRNKHVVRALCEAWCPETNTLHTDVGEVSISLMDLWRIGGLPVVGDCYEEIIPSLQELTGSNTRSLKPLPMSCQHLFAAFLQCLGDEYDIYNPKLSVAEWINFWCRLPLKYPKPIMTSARGANRPSKTYNPDGVIPNVMGPRSTLGDVELWIHEESRDETYLAAFIACWLCLFVLPANGSFIRPSTFKAASLIASGRRLSLASPVLVSIYKGLGKIVHSSTPERADSFLPWHYVFGWMGRYFDTHHRVPSNLNGPYMVRYSEEGESKPFDGHAARDLIHKGHNLNWSATTYSRDRTEIKENDNKLPLREKTFFYAVRSCFMVLHCNDLYWVEPYNPCRFARQLGFYQSFPKELTVDIRSTRIESARTLWRKFNDLKSYSKLAFPARPSHMSNHVSSDFRSWWSKVHGTYLSDGRPLFLETTTRTKKIISQVKENPAKLSRPLNISSPTAPRLASKVIATTKDSGASSKEKRRHDIAVETDGSISPGDVNWKRQRRADQQEEPEKQLKDGPLYVADPPQRSESSTNGPHNFTKMLLATEGENEVLSPMSQILGGSLNQVIEEGAKTARGTSYSSSRTAEAESREEPLKRMQVPTPRPHQHSPVVEVSEFNAVRILKDVHYRCVEMLWLELKKNISDFPLGDLALKRDVAFDILNEMKLFGKNFDLSDLERLLHTLFDYASHHCAAQADLAGKLTKDLYEEKRSALLKKFEDISRCQAEQVRDVELSRSDLSELIAKREALEKEVEVMKKKEAEMTISITSREEELKSIDTRASGLQIELNELESVPQLDPDEKEALNKMTQLLKDSRTQLLQFKLPE